MEKSVPRLLNVDLRQHWLDICSWLKEQTITDPKFLSNIWTGDESWVYTCDPKTKQQSTKGKSGVSATKRCQATSSMLFFDFWSWRNCPQGVCSSWSNSQYKLLPRGFEVLQDDVQRKWLNKWCNITLLLHTTISLQTLPSRLVSFWPPTTCSCTPSSLLARFSVLVASFSHRRWKMKLKGWRFETVEKIQAESRAVQNKLLKENFQRCFWS